MNYSMFNVDENNIYKLPYVCPHCLKGYSYKTTLTRHLKYECGKEPQFNCMFCKYKAAQKNNMLRHIKTYHSTEVNDKNNKY